MNQNPTPTMKKEQEYTPFGEEWEKELMKMPKKMIIDLYRISCVRKGKSPDHLLPDGYVEEGESVAIDYRALLIKYISHVSYSEGVDFLTDRDETKYLEGNDFKIVQELSNEC